MHTYKYELVEGHIIITADGARLLIDTGAPTSFSDRPPFQLAGSSFPALDGYMGATPESVSRNIGTTVNALVGADVLNRYDIHLDPTCNTLRMNSTELPLDGQSLRLDNFMGIPIIEAGIGNAKVRMFFDTGAKLSYIDQDRTESLQSVGTERDFYPMLGEFTTNVYNLPVTLGGESIMLRAGNLPSLLQMTLLMANTSGILGTALLNTHKVTLAPRRSMMAIQRI